MPRPRLPVLLWLLCLVAGACGSPGGPSSTEPAPSATAVTSSPSPPPPGFTFAVKGDWGAGTPEQAAVTSRMCEVRKAEPFDVVVTTGDNFYRPDGTATESNYFRPEACLISHPGHQWRATWGNHDAGRPSTGAVLGAERYYTWTAGPVQFFMLDSNRAADPAQSAWMAAELARSASPVKIAVFHHPPFTAGLHDNDLRVRERWVPLFEQFGVDLVLNGHNHAYEHSVVNGIHYVVTGGGGAEIYPCVRDEPWLVTCLPVNHFLLIEAKEDLVSVAALGTDGRPVDGFEVRPAA